MKTNQIYQPNEKSFGSIKINKVIMLLRKMGQRKKESKERKKGKKRKEREKKEQRE